MTRRRLCTILAGVALAVALGTTTMLLLGRTTQSSAAVLAHVPPAGRSDTAADPTLVRGINQLGLELLRSRLSSGGASVILSPISVHQALAMTSEGAGGTTRSEMRSVLGMDGMSEADSDQACADLLVGLAQGTGRQFSLANSLWADRGVTFHKPFLESDSRYFGAEVRTVDLQSPQAVDAINSWVSRQTHGRIEHAATYPLPADEMLRLIDATYFLGEWRQPFDAARSADFHLENGSTVKAQLMHVHVSERGLQYARTPTCELVCLPYRDSSAEMLVLLPTKGTSLDSFVRSLTATSLAETISTVHSRRGEPGDLTMPKVEARYEMSLVPDLSALGMHDAFDPDKADFSRATDVRPAWISSAKHLTYFRVDEKGTEAAAVTMIGVCGAAAPAPGHFEMDVDRPYLMAVVDDHSGAVLFLDAVRDPR